jgi:3-oxoacyl-[acyl-carrier protein] reductase
MNPTSSYQGKTVAITGAAGAYGRELADAFESLGARLLLSDAMSSHPRPPRSSNWRYKQADLSAAEDIESLAQWLLSEGIPDVLINNAGLFPFVDVMEISPQASHAIFSVNLNAPLRLMQRIGSAMGDRGSGVICNISSGAATVVRENGAVYGASKAALEQLTRAFALRLGPTGVRVNAIRPGLRGDTLEGIPAEHLQRVGSTVPLRRLAQQGEVTSVVTFLCSEAAAFITGEVIAVDGGNGINRRAPS